MLLRELVCALSAMVLVVMAGCGSSIRDSASTGPTARAAGPAWAVADPFAAMARNEGSSMRVGGDLATKVERRQEAYISGPCAITTPLPMGYPAPTPPGAIDLKRYPSVRRAQVTGTATPDLATNIAFFPLFYHIQRRKIDMTSPVELDYKGMRAAGEGGVRSGVPSEWNMAFLYRQAEQGAAGVDPKNEAIKVVDAEPVTVLAIGLKGPYSLGAVNAGVRELESWLAANPQWQAAGSDARAFYYNGPEQPNKSKWAEAQIAVRYVGEPAKK